MNITTKKSKDWDLLVLDGKFVVKQLMNIRVVLNEIENREKSPKIAFDLSKTSYIDSSAITAMLNLQKRLGEKNGNFVLIGPNEDITDILSIVGFDKLIPIFPTHQDFERSVTES